jgi:tetratricopeptide (TPR) repeat protein
MIGKKIKKFLGYRNNDDNKLKDKAGNIAKSISKSIDKFAIDLRLMSKKSKNLSDSNFKLGKKYYRRKNYSEAAFRFSILIKFWPEHIEGYFMLAKCLLAQGKFRKAEMVLNKLVRRKPALKNRAMDLLYHEKEETSQLKS